MRRLSSFEDHFLITEIVRAAGEMFRNIDMAMINRSSGRISSRSIWDTRPVDLDQRRVDGSCGRAFRHIGRVGRGIGQCAAGTVRCHVNSLRLPAVR